MKRYCVGFAFKADIPGYVYLIKKKRPEWQKGKLNGVGGKIEENETPLEAMVREFEEETGIKTTEEQWRYFCYLTEQGEDWEVFFFTTNLKKGAHLRRMNLEDECVYLIDWREYFFHNPEGLISNLQWLLPLSRENLAKHVVVIER